MNKNMFAMLVKSLGLALADLKIILSDEERFISYIFEFGYSVESIPTQYSNLLTTVNNIYQKVSTIDIKAATPSDINAILLDLKALYQGIQNLNAVPVGISDPNFIQKLPTIFFKNLLFKYFFNKQPALINFLRVFKIVKSNLMGGGETTGHYTHELDTASLKLFFSDPNATFRTLLNWDSNIFSVNDVFPYIKQFFNALGFPAVIVQTLGVEQFGGVRIGYPTGYLKIPLLFFYVSDYPIEVGLEIHNLNPETSTDKPGIAILPYFPTTISKEIIINDNLIFKWSADTNINQTFGVLIRPGEEVSLRYPSGNSSVPFSAYVNFSIDYKFSTPYLLLGSSTKSRLELGSITLELEIKVLDGKPEFIFGLNLKDLAVVLSDKDGDNFTNKLLSGEKRIPVILSVKWSSETGLHFTGSGGFEVDVPAQLTIGPITVDSVRLRIFASLNNPSALTAEAAASVTATIGPLLLTVKDIGIQFQATLGTGNAGPFGLKSGIRVPTGVGISIDSDKLTGGGFLAYDEAAATYTGALELTFSKVSLKAIGILTTRLPGGQSGYSLLILITAEFTPIQLGLGFTLNSVGGLLALNRTVDETALKNGIYNNTLGNILFPQNIVQNAGAIISSLNSIFPVKEGRFLVGPMAKIGWGTPTLLTIDLGIFIEMPAPVRLLLLGVLKASLPDEKKPILKLQVNFIGIIDFDKKKLSFDATLYNSKILTFALAGDMAVRLFWGDRPRFLITAGGFHPKFTPPPMELPNLRRLSISLVNTSNLRINAEAYYAITSNSAQFGASVNLWAKAWKATAEGKVWMDVLFKFSPFYFSADMGAHFAIKWNGKNKFSAQLTLKVEGPNPWRVQGEASFEICWIDVTIRFNKTFGQASTEVVAAVSLWPKVEAAVNHKDNWIIEGPERIQPMVTYREVPVTDTDLLIDPFGGLRFSQKVVPLNVTLQKSGSAAINDYVRFSIGQITSTPTPGNTITLPAVSTRDYFARNEFFFMTEDEKLSRESYELHESGLRIGNTDELFSDFFTLRVISYEETFIDLRYRYWRFGGLHLTPQRMMLHTYGNYISRSELSNFRDVTPRGGPAKVNLSAADNTFVLADRNSLTAVSSDTYLNFQQAQEQLVLLQSSQPAAAADYIIVNAFEL